MEVEAHKVIAISLGKIASSRIQRGGPKLYKNLLVANLIQKARVFFVDEPQNEDCEHQQSEEVIEQQTSSVSDPPNELNEIKSEPEVKPLQVALSLASDEEMLQGCEVSQNIERGKDWDENDKENDRPPRPESPAQISVDIPTEQKIIPLRCLKRRNHTSEEEASQFKRQKGQTDPSKFRRWRRTSITSSGCLSDTDSDSEDSFDHYNKVPSQVNVVFSVELHCESNSASSVPMDTEQISNLTSVFNNSFHGLGSTTEDNRKSNLTLDLCSRRQCDDSSKQFNSKTELVVCSKQAASILKVSFSSNKPLALAV